MESRGYTPLAREHRPWSRARLSSRALRAFGVAAHRSIVKEGAINRSSRRRAISWGSVSTGWHTRACVRLAVALRVDYVTADGRVWLGLVRNLSLQGMYIESALRHVAHEVAPGNLLTVAFLLPSGRPCKLRAIVIHCEHRGCGVEFLEGPTQSLANLASYWFSLKESAQ
jgi:hypothetical protein